jgi:glycosyltransferase involved in cell wall biosynthesis
MIVANSGHRSRVSIGMPVYNGERYIAETLDSLLAQTYENFELIICDNASQDRTEEICHSYAAKEPRIRYIRNSTNLGAAANYRLCFELSSGEYFRWANCDDLFAPTSLARCVEVLDRERSSVLTYPKTKLIDDRGQIISDYEDGLHLQSGRISERFIKLSLELGLVNAIYGLIRADVLKKTALIGNFIAADKALLAELTLYGKFWEIPEFLFYRRFHPGASSSFKSIEQFQEFFDPTTRGRVPFTQWRHLCANYRAVLRAPIENDDKWRVVVFLMRKTVWARRALTGELVMGLKRAVRAVFHWRVLLSCLPVTTGLF